MTDKLSLNLYALNLHIGNALEKVLQSDPVGGRLNSTQLALFRHLFSHSEENVYQRDLEKVFMLSRSTASRVLQGLEGMGLLTRSGVDADGRLKQLILTPKGMELGAKLNAFYREVDQCITSGLTVKEKQGMCRMLERMQDSLKQLTEKLEGGSYPQ